MVHIDWQEATQLDKSLLSLVSFLQTQPSSAQLLSGGLTNRCWKLNLPNGASYVWRPCSEFSRAFSVSRKQERDILSFLNTLPSKPFITPKPVHLNQDGLLVEWLDGEPLSSDINTQSLIALAADIHSVSIEDLETVPFSYVSRIDHYWFQIQDSYQNTVYEDLYKQWRTLPAQSKGDVALCHFDLGSYNLIHTDAAFGVIDWEYATLSDPKLDLAMVIDLSAADINQSVETYCQLRNFSDVREWKDGVVEWIPRARVMAMLWFLLGHKLWADAHYLDSAEQIRHTICS